MGRQDRGWAHQRGGIIKVGVEVIKVGVEVIKVGGSSRWGDHQGGGIIKVGGGSSRRREAVEGGAHTGLH